MSTVGHPVTVYIVDDDESVRRGLSRLMRASGLQSRAFATPEQFLEEVTEEPAGCIVLDVTMPGMTGPQVQIRLREMGVHLPVIALSARDSDEIRQIARSLGAQFFLRKPADDQALLDAIAWVTDSTRRSHGEPRPGQS